MNVVYWSMISNFNNEKNGRETQTNMKNQDKEADHNHTRSV